MRSLSPFRSNSPTSRCVRIRALVRIIDSFLDSVVAVPKRAIGCLGNADPHGVEAFQRMLRGLGGRPHSSRRRRCSMQPADLSFVKQRRYCHALLHRRSPAHLALVPQAASTRSQVSGAAGVRCFINVARLNALVAQRKSSVVCLAPLRGLGASTGATTLLAPPLGARLAPHVRLGRVV